MRSNLAWLSNVTWVVSLARLSAELDPMLESDCRSYLVTVGDE